MARRRGRSRGYGGYGGYWRPYVPVAQRRANARREAARLEKKGRRVAPVEIAGRRIAATFWGRAWCDNLESYSDFENRLPRGRTYLRNGSVIDLQIEPGRIRSLVSGSEIYEIDVEIDAVERARWSDIVSQCAGEIDSLVELLQGRFSKGVMAVLCRQRTGLFPTPSEIRMRCSCPDWAVLCKHVAATLYGVGARLDEQPELLFRLRQVDESDLVQTAATASFDGDGATAPDRALAPDDLSSLFGIDLADPGDTPARKAPRRKAGRRRTTKKAIGQEITARELTTRGVGHPTIQSWLRSGVLERSGRRGVYRKTDRTDRELQKLLGAPTIKRRRDGKKAAVKTGRSPAKEPARKKTGPKKRLDAGQEITARELTTRGVGHPTIQSWLRSGVLERSGRRGVYRRTDRTEWEIQKLLGPPARASRRAAKRATPQEKRAGAGRQATSRKKPPKKRPSPGRKKTGRKKRPAAGQEITARELTARGVDHPTIRSWLRSGVLERSGRRGVYLATAETAARLAERE